MVEQDAFPSSQRRGGCAERSEGADGVVRPGKCLGRTDHPGAPASIKLSRHPSSARRGMQPTQPFVDIIANTEHPNVYNQETTAAPHLPSGRRCDADVTVTGSNGARCDCSRANSCESKTAICRCFLSARYGAGSLGARERRAASRETTVYHGDTRKSKGSDSRYHRPVVQIGGTARRHDRFGSLGGCSFPDCNQAEEDGRFGRERGQSDDRSGHCSENWSGQSVTLVATRR